MKILIISEHIAPLQTIGSVRWTNIAKYLKKNHNAEIDIVTNKKVFNYQRNGITVNKVDEFLNEKMVFFDNYFQVECGGMYRLLDRRATAKKRLDASYKRRDFSKGIVEPINKKVLLFQKATAFFVSKFINRSGKKYDAIISTYNPMWPLIAAGSYKKRHPDTIWLSDFRDPWMRESDTRDIHNEKSNFLKERLKQADVLLRVNDYFHIYDDPVQPVIGIPNGYDHDEKRSNRRSDKFNLVLTGLLYDGLADMRPVFRALRELISGSMVLAEDVSFLYAGSDSSLFIEQAKSEEMEGFCIDMGFVPRPKALEMQLGAAILLNSCSSTKFDPGGLSGKMYEYMMTGKPVILTVVGDYPSYVADSLKKMGGYCYEEYDSSKSYYGLKQYILEKYKMWKETGDVRVDRDEEFVSQFDYSNIADRVYNLILEIKEQRR